MASVARNEADFNPGRHPYYDPAPIRLNRPGYISKLRS